MKFLPKLFENNRAWAEQRKLEDPQYFERLSGTQMPEFLWIGCADSRVCPEFIFDQRPGAMFDIRNAGNVVDDDVMASLE